MILLNVVCILLETKAKLPLLILETETSFMPWLMHRTMTQVNQIAVSRTILDSTIRDAVNQRIDQYQRLGETSRQVKLLF